MERFLYVNEDAVSSDLKCGVCSSPLIDPVEHSTINSNPCSQIYCYECVISATQCPNCSHKVSSWQQVPNTPSVQKILTASSCKSCCVVYCVQDPNNMWEYSSTHPSLPCWLSKGMWREGSTMWWSWAHLTVQGCESIVRSWQRRLQVGRKKGIPGQTPPRMQPP